MTATIIIIGDEILMGQVTDTNSGEISRRLGPRGWQIKETIVVGDDLDSIHGAVRHALGNSDLVITTGGLGPTKDDITKQALIDIFGGTLKEDASVLSNVERVFAARGLKMNELTRRQALVPTSCRVIQNELGTAPIMWFDASASQLALGEAGKVLIAMPGVPFETTGMLDRAVVSEISAHFSPDITVLHRTFIVTGITESDLAEKLRTWEDQLDEGLHLAYLPSPGYIRLRIDGIHPDSVYIHRAIDEAAASLRLHLGKMLIHEGDASPAEILLERLRAQNLTVSTAESCTGGNIAHQITSVPGSSDCYAGSIVSYSNSVKHNVLGVSRADLDTHGAVSEEVVRQMAQGTAQVIDTDCAIATSGIAGPGGAVPGKPVGTVWIAVHTPRGTESKAYRFPGNRTRVIERATTTAILMLIEQLNDTQK